MILYQPEIPPNTGNVIRLCANVGATLHLIRPLGFSMDAASLRRAGLDYHALADVHEHDSLAACLEAAEPRAVYALSTKGRRSLFAARFEPRDAFVLGPETRGLPPDVLASLPPEKILRLPLAPGNRSINLSNAAAVTLYEAWRQNGFGGSVDAAG